MLGRATAAPLSVVVRIAIDVLKYFMFDLEQLWSIANRTKSLIVAPRALLIEDELVVREMLCFVLQQHCFDSQLVTTLS